MKKAIKKGMTKMSATKSADMKAMSPQDKFKAMIAAKKAKSAKGKDVKKMSYGAAAKSSKKGALKMSMTKKSGKK